METLVLKSKQVAIMSKPSKDELRRLVPEVVAWLQQHGFQVVIDRETSNYVKGLESITRAELASRPLDFVVLLGGDGTLLAAARAVAQAGIPVVGVNLGSLGFLTEVTQKDLFSALDSVHHGRARIEERTLLFCRVERNEQVVAEHVALNEVVVGKNNVARLSTFELRIDGDFVSDFRADGLIVSTPTGSTAYSLAAGGPILTPSVPGFVITPVSPHSLSHRPLVVRDTCEITVSIKEAREDAFVSFDGQVGVEAKEGDLIRCHKAGYTFKLLHFGSTFFDVLRSKLKWGQT